MSALFALKTCLFFVWLAFSTAQADTLRVTDAEGRVLTLAAPAERIVALAPHVVENAFAAGIGDRIVGAVDYADYPEAAAQLPRVGNYTSVSLESIIALKPDLILAWGSGNPRSTLEKLDALGIPVYIDEPRSFDALANTLKDFGTLGGEPVLASQRADQFLQRIQRLRQRYAEAETVSVFYEVWNQPLQTINGKHLISDVMRLCAGVNVFAEETAIAPLVSVESVIAADPDVIIASGMDASRPEWLDEWLRYPMIHAVATQQLHHIHPDLLQRHTPRIADGAEQMCAQLAEARTK